MNFSKKKFKEPRAFAPIEQFWLLLGSLLVVAGGTFVFSSFPLNFLENGDLTSFLFVYLVTLNFALVFGFAWLGVAHNRNLRRYRKLKIRETEQSKRREIIVKSFEYIFGNLENISTEYADVSLYISDSLIEENYNEEVDRKVKRCLDRFLSELKGIFDEYTNDNCSVCIKILEVPSEAGMLGQNHTPPIVTTLLRDSVSSPKRRKYDTEFQAHPYDGNAAFWNIIHEPKFDNYFFSNDLSQLEKYGQYYNRDQSWSKLYNATAVVPIKNPRNSTDEKIIGFLCVDNHEGGFDNRISKDILTVVSSLIYYILLLVTYIKSNSALPESTR